MTEGNGVAKDLPFTHRLRLTPIQAKRLKIWGFWLAVTLLLVGVILLTGITLADPKTYPYQHLAQNPFISRTNIDPENYWQADILLPLAAYLAHVNTPLLFSIFCLVIILAGYVMFAAIAYRKFGPGIALLFTALLAMNPLTTVLLSWLGTPDGLTFALSVPFLGASSVPLLFLLAALGVANHVMFIIPVMEMLVLRWVSEAKIRWTHLAAALAGAGVGFGAVQAFLFFNHIQVMSRLGYIFTKSLAAWVANNTEHFSLTLFSLYNIQWLLVLLCMVMFFRKDWRYYACLLVFLLLNYGVVFFTYDTTRIYALLSWGIFMHCLFHSYQLSLRADPQQGTDRPVQKRFFRALAIVGCLSVVAPRFYSWVGAITWVGVIPNSSLAQSVLHLFR